MCSVFSNVAIVTQLCELCGLTSSTSFVWAKAKNKLLFIYMYLFDFLVEKLVDSWTDSFSVGGKRKISVCCILRL